jgi:hypothetical protein
MPSNLLAAFALGIGAITAATHRVPISKRARWFRMQTSIPSMWSGAIQKRLNSATLVTPAFRCAAPILFRRPKGDMDDDQTYDRDRRRNPSPALLPSAVLPWSCLPSVSPRPARASAGSWSVAHATAAVLASDGRVSIARPSGVSAIRSPSRHRRGRRTCRAVLRCPRRPAERS